MNILIALLPALLWGCTPIWVHFLGGKPINQLLGTTYGALVVGIVIYLIKRPTITASTFWWCFLAGVAWSLGQLISYISFKKMSVSTTIPVSAGVQLVTVNIAGILFFGSWASITAKIVGAIAVVFVIYGVVLTTKTGEKNPSKESKSEFVKNISLLLFGSTVGYGSCSVLPRIPEAAGWATFPPQSLGMLVAAVVFALAIKEYRDSKPLFDRQTLRNIITGFNSGLGTFTYLVSIMLNGVATGFTLSQMTTVVSTFGGLVIIREQKTHKQKIYTVIGVALVMLGGIMTGFIK